VAEVILKLFEINM